MANRYESQRRLGLKVQSSAHVGAGLLVFMCAAAAPAGVLAKSTDPLAQDATITSIQRVGPQTGWAANEQTLYWTQAGGASWQDITPPKAAGERLEAVTFLDTANGFVLLASSDVAGMTSPAFRLASTPDGGATWFLTPISFTAPENLSGGGSISFRDALHGVALLKVSSSSNFSRAVLLTTADGGHSWNRLPDPPAAGTVQFISATSGKLVGGPDGNAVYVTEDGGLTWQRPAEGATQAKQALVAPVADLSAKAINITPNAAVSAASTYSSAQGWVLLTSGQCQSDKSGCRQVTQLLTTESAGASWSEITPQAVATLDVTPLATAPVSTKKGFDTCAAPSSSSMSRCWSGPFRDVNIYIGGENRACSQTNLSKSWISTVSGQGWYFIPTWVGPQAPCSGVGATFSSNATTARSQAISQAKSAAAAAKALGLDKTVVYYDMEYYPTSSASCNAAVQAFVDGWTSEMHTLGFHAGVYGSPIDANIDWHGLDHNPDAVWLASWNGVASVWGISPLSDTLWKYNQRIHQYRGGHNETWGGITLNIDSDIEDAPVAKP